MLHTQFGHSEPETTAIARRPSYISRSNTQRESESNLIRARPHSTPRSPDDVRRRSHVHHRRRPARGADAPRTRRERARGEAVLGARVRHAQVPRRKDAVVRERYARKCRRDDAARRPREDARERATRERGDEVIGRRWTRARRASEARAGRGGRGDAREDAIISGRRGEDARTRGRGRRARTRREGGCGEERARGETDGEAVRRRAIATTGSTRSSSAKSRRTSRATARRSSCTRDGPCSASPV